MKIVVYTPIYHEKSGGRIVLHKLCDMLQQLGIEAKIWPKYKPGKMELRSFSGVKKALKWFLRILPKSALGYIDLSSPYNLSIAKYSDLENAIIVYPEVVSGNPLGSRKVVRWLLYKPKNSKKLTYGKDDLIFYYQEHFNDWDMNPNSQNHLNVIEIMGQIYKKRNFGPRSGTCYIIKKGSGRQLNSHDRDSIKIDGLGHKDISDIFNRCKYFVSYDLYTMYSRYAAMCGCIPIVVPDPNLSKEQWCPEIENRYGIAYGWDDIPWALETRNQLFSFLESSQLSSEKSVINFVKILAEYFPEQEDSAECE